MDSYTGADYDLMIYRSVNHVIWLRGICLQFATMHPVDGQLFQQYGQVTITLYHAPEKRYLTWCDYK
jgi:hypothetical protein